MARGFCMLAACDSVPSTSLNLGLSVIETLRTFCGGEHSFQQSSGQLPNRCAKSALELLAPHAWSSWTTSLVV